MISSDVIACENHWLSNFTVNNSIQERKRRKTSSKINTTAVMWKLHSLLLSTTGNSTHEAPTADFGPTQIVFFFLFCFSQKRRTNSETGQKPTGKFLFLLLHTFSPFSSSSNIISWGINICTGNSCIACCTRSLNSKCGWLHPSKDSASLRLTI